MISSAFSGMLNIDTFSPVLLSFFFDLNSYFKDPEVLYLQSFAMFQSVVLFSLIYCAASATQHPDEIKSLPGLNFTLNYKQYSGYLNATDGKFLFYW